jgi:MFS family permease
VTVTTTRTGAHFLAATPVCDALIASYAFTVVMLSTTLPTPIYAIYAQRLHLKPLMITVIFAVYAVGVLSALLLFGRLSDQIGRRPVLLLGMATSLVSGAIFVSSGQLPALFAGRLVSGISAGLVTGAVTAYISELDPDPRRGPLLATLANMGGLGCGPLVAGVLAEHVAHPTQVPYIVGAALLVPALLVLQVRETVEPKPGGVRAGIKPQRLGVPREIRVPFTSAAIAGFVAFAMLGFITSVVGNFLAQGLGNHSHQTAGVVAFLVFMTGAMAQLIAGRFSVRTASLTGLALLPIGLLVLTLALPAKSLPLFLIGSMVGGAGSGFAFRAAVLGVNAFAPANRRGEVLSTFFVVAYVGIIVPVIGVGLLLNVTTLLTTAITFALLLTVLAAIAATILVRIRES